MRKIDATALALVAAALLSGCTSPTSGTGTSLIPVTTARRAMDNGGGIPGTATPPLPTPTPPALSPDDNGGGIPGKP